MLPAGTDPSIPAAWILGGTALAGVLVNTLTTRRKITKTVGIPNGNGNVVQMLTRVLEDVGEVRGELRGVKDDVGGVKRQIAEVVDNQVEHAATDTERFDACDAADAALAEQFDALAQRLDDKGQP